MSRFEAVKLLCLLLDDIDKYVGPIDAACADRWKAMLRDIIDSIVFTIDLSPESEISLVCPSYQDGDCLIIVGGCSSFISLNDFACSSVLLEDSDLYESPFKGKSLEYRVRVLEFHMHQLVRLLMSKGLLL